MINYTKNGLIILPPNVLVPKTLKKPNMIIMDFTAIQTRKNSQLKDVMDELKSLFDLGFGHQRKWKNDKKV